ncbi:hypothetical protein [Mycobacterium sp. SMC-4]|uniref:hypothetical protein n=1 Tax=Mycobacterium sp. SMC-4 TaxID=2857059 RepID=UPI0021B44640|nr:hypothetical protein [Mycobacterium sp. SMC-4]UXA17026.1 hypothetical protein KXD98_20050 [Mycobacterium sp. SMC-4]
MSIEVKLTEDSSSQLLSDEGDWYDFLPSGVLALHFGNGIQAPQYYSPHAWEYVSSEQPPGQPGSPQVY